MPHIDYFCSPISPNVYLAGTRLEDVAARYGATISYRPVDIPGLFARTGGVMLGERHPNRQEYRLQELRRGAVLAGVPINLNPAHFPTNAAPACYALIAAQAAGGGDLGELSFGLARACWAEERNVADDTVIRDCLSKAGFDPGLADSGLLAGATAFEANLEDAVARGVFGLPFYLVDDGERFWGHDRIEQLDKHLSGAL
jgi:2-hydroxychromene-2-carboxylate isomerase